MNDLDLRQFTPQMKRLIRALGVADTALLLRWRGGRRLCLPQSAERSELAQLIGPAAVQKLIEIFGAGTWIQLPKVDKIILAERNKEILAEYAAGHSISEIAVRYGLTWRRVWGIVSDGGLPVLGDPAGSQQSELF